MNEQFKALLRENGFSLTKPRLVVFKLLYAQGPLSTDQLVNYAAKVDRASVYRTLTTFRQLGVIEDIITGGKKMVELTDRFNPHHHHLVCIACGKSLDITDPAIEQRLDSIAKRFNFTAANHQIEVSGLCANCA